MRNRIWRAARRSGVFIVVLVLFSVAGAAGASTADTFDDPAAPYWNEVSGDWSVVHGEYIQARTVADNGGATLWGREMISLAAEQPGDAFIVEAEMRLINENRPPLNWWGITFHYQDSSAYEVVCFGYHPNYLFLDYWAYDGVEWRLIDQRQLPDEWDPFQSHRLRLAVDGSAVEIYFDGDLLLAGVDPTAFTGGSVGLWTETAAVAFDNWVLLNPDPEQAVTDLGEGVADLDLDTGLSTVLGATLDGALAILDDANLHNDSAAAGNLAAFVNQLEALAGRRISNLEADALIALAQEIIDLLTDRGAPIGGGGS